MELRGSDENTCIAVMAPRAGKLTVLVISVTEGVAPSGKRDKEDRNYVSNTLKGTVTLAGGVE
ncbi:hypothetical protein [Streptomyces sp. Wb2n-11]|uniref:hypothetical protein n=1 Tax=Streptomyces sp. Wb2n-11 TaxID=1030533 RepID=UPI00159EF411|nr:hypothetical protein [Streptomyces sp. Wb2n-11]